MRVFSDLKGSLGPLDRFLRRDESGGTTTIEFVLWLPIFVLILSLIVDVSFLFLRQAIMYDVASDTARRYAVGAFAGASPADSGTANEVGTEEETAKVFAQNAATFGSVIPNVSVNEANGAVTVAVSHALQDVDVTGVLNFVASQTIDATVVQLVE